MSNKIELNSSVSSIANWPEQCKTGPTTNPISDIAQKFVRCAQSLKDATCTVVHYLTPSRSFSDYFTVCTPPLSTTPAEGPTPLHLAIISNDLEGAKKLLELGADPNAADSRGRSLLHKAVISESTEMVEILVQHGARVNTKDSAGWTPLHTAAVLQNIQIIECLLIHEGSYNPALLSSSAKALITLITALSKAKRQTSRKLTPIVTVNPPETQSELLLTPIVTVDPPETQSELLQKVKRIFSWQIAFTTGVGVAIIGLGLMTAGLLGGHPVGYLAGLILCSVGLLIANAANKKIANAALKKTTLHEAVFEGNLAKIEYLVKSGADINVKDSDGFTPLYNAVLIDELDVAQKLIALGADINARDSDGWTLLHLAVWRNKLDLIEKLITLGADIEARDSNGFTPLYHAVLNGKLDVSEKLIALSADVEDSYSERKTTPLYAMLIKKAFANTKALEAAIQASNGTSQERIDRQLLANRFALDGASELSANLYRLGGFKVELANPALKDATSSFYSPIIADLQSGDDKRWNNILQMLSPENRQRINSLSKSKMIEILKNALEAVINSVSGNVDIVLDRHTQGLPVAIATTWGKPGQTGHEISLVLYGDKIARCNKGRGSGETPGALISTIGKPEALRKALEHCIPKTTETYFTKEIATELELSHHKRFAQKTQRGPNCPIANTNSMGPLALYMQLAPLVGDEAAEEFTKVFKRLNSINTRLNSTQSYLTKHEQLQPYGVDVGLIGQIYSKITGKPEIDQQIRGMIEKWVAKRNIDLEAATILGTVQAFLGNSMDPEMPLPDLSLVSHAYELKTGSDDIDCRLRSMIDLWAQERNLQWQEGSQKTEA